MVELLTISLVDSVVKSALGLLKRRHGVEGIPYLLSDDVHNQYTKAVEVATKALLGSLERELAHQPQYRIPFHSDLEMFKSIEGVVTSPGVVEEISNLLDPGLEVFDRYKLVTVLASALPTDFPGPVREDFARNAWAEFLKAFSFASRSMPELREFLRASYEAGSFRRISDIAGAVESFDSNITNLAEQEESLRNALSAYTQDLMEYRKWAQAYR